MQRITVEDALAHPFFHNEFASRKQSANASVYAKQQTKQI